MEDCRTLNDGVQLHCLTMRGGNKDNFYKISCEQNHCILQIYCNAHYSLTKIKFESITVNYTKQKEVEFGIFFSIWIQLYNEHLNFPFNVIEYNVHAS